MCHKSREKRPFATGERTHYQARDRAPASARPATVRLALSAHPSQCVKNRAKSDHSRRGNEGTGTDRSATLQRHRSPVAMCQESRQKRPFATGERMGGRGRDATRGGPRAVAPRRAGGRNAPRPLAPPHTRKKPNNPGLCACASTRNTTASKRRCTVTTYPSERVFMKMKPCNSANGIVRSGPHAW